MTCNQTNDLIPGLIRREIGTSERIEAIDHLRNCLSCRSEYLQQLKLYCNIDKNLVSLPVTIDPIAFKNDLNNKIRITPKTRYGNIKWYGAIAAVLLILFLSIQSFLKDNNKVNYSKSAAPLKAIETALEKEDWPNLQKILMDSKELRNHANEKIPLDLLIDKLRRLEKSGVESISFSDLFNQAGEASPEFNDKLVNSGLNEVRIDALIKTLKQFSPYTNQTSLLEISTYLDKNKSGGIDS